MVTSISEKGKLTISLDAEIAWGRVSSPVREEFYPLFENTREVVGRLLDLFDKYSIPVTWALVGRLIDPDSQNRMTSDASLDKYYDGAISESIYEDSKLNASTNSYLNWPELVSLIQGRPTQHELASHTYNHYFSQDIADGDLIDADLKTMKLVCEEAGFTPRSLVFPKNQVGYLENVAAAGIKTFRGPDETWFASMPQKLHKFLRQIDLVLPIAAPTVTPSVGEHGLVNIPGSMLFRREHIGIKRLLPFGTMSKKANLGLENAAKNGQVVHLWWHPFNFAYRADDHFKELEKVLVRAAQLRDRGDLEVRTMGSYSK